MKGYNTKKEIRELNGYRVIYRPNHPSAMTNQNWLGYIYEHIAVAIESLGRPLNENEIVHHLDGNRQNNVSKNLLVLDRTQHAKIHKWLKSGAPYCESVGVNGENCEKPKWFIPKYCKCCGVTLQNAQESYCSTECRSENKRIVERPSVKQLTTDIQENSMLAVGRKYGVSNAAIRKWCVGYGIDYKAIRSRTCESVKSNTEVQRLEGEYGNDKPSQAPHTVT